ncbi:MAG TPA: lysylphosphatidylglycerol synthase transmembrane domain-containing protein [Jatrophihabitantaceae bacterium]
MARATLKVETLADAGPRRVRRPMDLVRLCFLLVLLALLIVLGVFAQGTMSGSSEDLARALNHLPRALTHVLSFVAGLLMIALPIGYMIDMLVQRSIRLLLDAVTAGVIALGLVWTLGKAVTAAGGPLYDSLRLTSTGVATAHVDTYLAAVAAFGVAGGMTRDVRWRWYYAGTLIVYAMSALAGAQASLLALAVSFVAGTAVAVAFRFAIGAVDKRPGAQRIADVLVDRGVRLVRLSYLSDHTGPYRQFTGVTETGSRLHIVVLDRDLVPSGLAYRIYRVLRVRREVARGPTLSMERAAERRALLAMLAERAGIPTPALVAGVPCGPDAIVLAHEFVDATPIAATAPVLRDAQLIELWQGVSRLHESRVTHRELTPERMSVDDSGVVWVASPTDGTAFANNLRINLDRAELLVTTARLVGARRAVSVAHEVLGADGLSAVRPLLQPVGFSQDTRVALRHNRQLLPSLMDELDRRLASPPPEPSHLERVRPRTVLMIVALIIGGYLLIAQLGSVDLATVFASTHWEWAPVVLAASALRYVGSALALTGFVRERLSFGRTVLAQLAGSFTGFVTPASVGGLALNVQYLRKAGVSTAGATTSVAVNQAFGLISYLVLLVLFGVASGTSTRSDLPIPGWAFIVLGVAVAVVALVMALPRGREWVRTRIMPTVREVLPRLAYTATRPVKLLQAVGGTLCLNGGFIAALYASVAAFGGGVPLATVAVVYLAGGAIGSAAPTPGGLGAVEAAISAGLVAAGMPGASAVSAVLLFRLATFWLPVPLGWLAYAWMQRHDWL